VYCSDRDRGKIKAVAQDPNSDVDRAMTALGATPMTYHSFAAVPSAPTVSTPAAGGAADFPLLVSALPEVARFQMPHPLSARTSVPDNPERSATRTQASTNAGGVETAAQASTNLETGPNVMPISGQDRKFDAPTASSSVDPPFRRPPPSRGPQPHSVGSPLDGIGGHRTPLGAVFRTLHTAESNRKPQTEAQVGLQNMFSRL
jgi:hypothetical protein